MSAVRSLTLFGSLVAPEEIPSLPVASEGANRSQLALALALHAAGVSRLSCITGLPVRAFPGSGPPLVRTRHWRLCDQIDIVAPAFLNIAPVKPFSMHRALRRWAVRNSRARRPDAVVSFNPVPGFGSAAAAAARQLGVPFVLIVADYTPPEATRSFVRSLQSRWGRRIIQRATALVVFSGHTVRDLHWTGPWVKLDAGVDPDWMSLPSTEPIRHRTIAYAGSLTVGSGVELLLDAFSRVSNPDIRLVLSGRGPLEPVVDAAAMRDPRIRYLGLVSRPEFQRLLASATLLVNPRLSSDGANRYNFPGKLPDYLASGRPVITTLAGDLDAEYLDVTIPLREETPAELAGLFESVSEWPESRLTALGTSGREFVMTKRMWPGQAIRVLALVEELLQDQAHGRNG